MRIRWTQGAASWRLRALGAVDVGGRTSGAGGRGRTVGTHGRLSRDSKGPLEGPWDCVDGEGKAAKKEASNEGVAEGPD